MELTYTQRCELAATAQGLDPIVEALTAVGMPVEVQQTGGYCMVAVVLCVRGAVAVIDDGGEYLVGTHTGTQWQDGDVGRYSTDIRTLEGMTSRTRAEVASLGGPAWAEDTVTLGDTADDVCQFCLAEAPRWDHAKGCRNGEVANS